MALLPDWDNIIESRPARESTPALGRGCCRLPLKTAGGAVRHWLKTLDREPGRIDPELRSRIRKVAVGDLPWPLYLYGGVGTGKTCAALCLLDHSAGLYFSASEFTAQAIAAMKGELIWPWRDHPVNDGQFWEAVEEATLVVLDDLGTRARPSEAEYDRVKRLLDVRHARPLVVVSNMSLDGVSQVFDDRVASRLAAGTVLYVGGPDRRLEP